MDAWNIWFIVAIALFIAEIFTPGFFLACLGISAFVSGVVDLIGGGAIAQFVFFCLTTLLVLIALRPLLVRFFGSHQSIIKTNYRALAGKVAVVEITIDGREDRGRVKIGGESWRAVAKFSSAVIPVGAMVKVLDVDGNKVVVEPFKEG